MQRGIIRPVIRAPGKDSAKAWEAGHLRLLWSVLSIAVGKGASLFAQLILGWLLSKEDFALYAIAISWSTIVMAMRNGGTQRLLIQKGAQYSHLAVMYLKFALLFNVGGFAVLMGRHQFYPACTTVIPCARYDLDSRVVVALEHGRDDFQAKLSADLEFAKVSRLIILSSLARHGSMVVFAWLGLGPLSFVLPLCCRSPGETALGWYWTKRWPPEPFTDLACHLWDFPGQPVGDAHRTSECPYDQWRLSCDQSSSEQRAVGRLFFRVSVESRSCGVSHQQPRYRHDADIFRIGALNSHARQNYLSEELVCLPWDRPLPASVLQSRLPQPFTVSGPENGTRRFRWCKSWHWRCRCAS